MNCIENHIFNLNSEKELYCYESKKDNMINIKYKKCKSEWCETCANSKYDNYCSHCYFHLYPDNILSINYY